MPANIGEIWLIVIFPAVLTLIQMLVPRKTRPLYLWLGFAVVCTLSVGVTLYLGRLTNYAQTLIVLSGGIPIVFAAVRFALLPFWRRYRELEVLHEILGAIDWGLKRSRNIDTFAALESVRTSFNFMGFGFSKYLKAKPDRSAIRGKANLKDSLLWKKLETIYFAAPNQSLRILMMNPLAHEIEKYSKFLKERYPDLDVEEDLYFSLDCLKEIQRAFERTVQVRFYPNSQTYKPSFRLFFCNDGELYVSFYRWGTTGTDLPYLHLRKSDRTFYLPFQILFDYLWQHGEPADIENMPLTVEFEDIYTRRPYSIDRIRKYIRHQLPAHLREVPFEQLRIAAAAIAGRDSTLAILRSTESGLYDCIVPILVGTPAKYLDAEESSLSSSELGGFEVRSNTIRKLKQVVKERNGVAERPCHLLNMIFIATDTRAWVNTLRRIEGSWRFDADDLEANQAFMSPCVPCHVYIYYLRAMLCHRLGIKQMIGGDRLFHDQVVKVNQMERVLETIREVIAQEFDVEFITPLKEIVENAHIRKLLDVHGLGSVHDVSCIFDGQGTISLKSFECLDEDEIDSVSRKIKSEVVPALRRTMYELYGSRKS
jgi:hypothetical protein